MITSAQFNDLVKNALVQWNMARKEEKPVRSILAYVKPVTEATSEHSDISSVVTARRRNQGDDSFKGTLKQGYKKNFNQVEISLQYDVTKYLRKFDKYDEIMRRMRLMGRGAERRMELDIASLLSYAWDSSYTNLDGETVTTTTPDGQPLISTAHTPNKASSTWSNEVSTTHNPISPAVLEDLEEKFNNFEDDGDGRTIPISPSHIISGKHSPTVNEIERILKSPEKPDTAERAINVQKGKLKHLIVPFIDRNAATEKRDANKIRYCFVAQLDNKDENGFMIEQSQGIEFEPPEQVFESSTWQFLTTAYYDFGTLRANFISGTKGTGAAV